MNLQETLAVVDAKSQVLATLEGYVAHCNADYAKWAKVIDTAHEVTGEDPVRLEMYKKFADGWEFKVGRKWIKVVKTSCGQKSVHSFICIEAHGKFKIGDIAKPASWHQPAKNFARGNVLTGDLSRVCWTGAL